MVRRGAMNEAEVKALRLDSGSQQGSRLWCQWVFPDGKLCDTWVGWHEGEGMKWDYGDVKVRVCREHWNLLNVLDQVRKACWLSEGGQKVWERNYWMARGRAEMDGD